ncbi:MAG: DegV family protein [Oscillospiraceae bacterium]|nr:DegV family protein [Oscillospiraceae bacterium]
MSVRIIVDSTADMIPELKKRCVVVPLTVHFGDEEYVDGITMSHEQFYEKLVETDVMPSTSQANPETFQKYFEEVTAAGDSAVVITLTADLSGTCQSAMIAAADFDNIHVVDGRSVAIGSGILAERALQLVDQGLDAASIAAKLNEEKNRVRVIAMVDTLEYLWKGGRLSRTAAVAGGLLNIKPVLAIEDGNIKVLGKARGSRQANNYLVSEIQKYGGVDFDMPVLLGYTGLSDALLKKYIEDSKALWAESKTELNSTIIGSVIGTHAGPGAVAVAFFCK